MREIKFRAWDNRKKQMLEFDLDDAHKLIPYTDCPVMQFTGLKDENGKEIYEGDIVHTPAKTDNIWEIYWHLNGFCLGRKRKDKSVLDWPTDENGYVCYGRSWVDIEVIGNIYENPELLDEWK